MRRAIKGLSLKVDDASSKSKSSGGCYKLGRYKDDAGSCYIKSPGGNLGRSRCAHRDAEKKPYNIVIQIPKDCEKVADMALNNCRNAEKSVFRFKS